jgi:hypothetical protein
MPRQRYRFGSKRRDYLWWRLQSPRQPRERDAGGREGAPPGAAPRGHQANSQGPPAARHDRERVAPPRRRRMGAPLMARILILLAMAAAVFVLALWWASLGPL